MLDLTGIVSLLSPLLIAAGVLIGIGVADTQEVYVRELTVPPSFTQLGYTAEVVERRVRDNLLTLEREAHTRPEMRRLAIEADRSPLQLIADYLNLTLISRAMQEASGLIEYSITGSVVQVGENYVMRLHFQHDAGQQMQVTITRPIHRIDEMLDDAAVAVLRVIDPQILCTLRLRQGLLASPRSFDEARSCITDTLPTAAPQDRVWLHNLQGVIAFMRSDYAGATAAFREALRVDPYFSPALLNLGVLFAQNGRHEEAIRAYATVFRRPTRGDSTQTYAATYAEWGASLMALGRTAEARRRFADAVRADPRYAPAYFFWADSLPPGPEADRLRHLGSAAERDSDQIYTENLVRTIRASGWN
jgi:tetratricopeptide (TPR) repeat protein